jgi:TrmH family RNA methyltransferase
VEEVTPALLKSSADENPQGILGVSPASCPAGKADFVVVADGLRPGATWAHCCAPATAGAHALPLARARRTPIRLVLRAMGAHFHLPLRSLDWPGIAKRVKPGCKLLLAETGEGTPCWQADLRQPLALVVGSEAEGAGAEARALADGYLTIPMPGRSESLNAAVAAGILLFEVVRQREKKD